MSYTAALALVVVGVACWKFAAWVSNVRAWERYYGPRPIARPKRKGRK